MFTELCSPWTGWPSLEGPLCLWHTWHCHIWFLGGNPRNGCYPKNSLAFGSFNILILPSLSSPLSTTSWHVDLVNGAGSPCKLGLPVIWSLLLVQVGQARRPTGPHPARHYTTHPWLHTPATSHQGPPWTQSRINRILAFTSKPPTPGPFSVFTYLMTYLMTLDVHCTESNTGLG